MIDFGSILAITTMFAVRDYYNDKEKMKKEKANQYKICFDKIGDNVETLGNIIISTLEKSGRVDLENEIIKGAQQIPLYILLEVVKIQGRPITSHQRKIIDICFNNFRHLGFTKQDYFTALASDNQTRKKLAESVELSIDYCGEFWEKYIDLVYTTSMSERSFTKLISCYSEIVVRLSLLGDCNVDRAEWVYKKFSDGLEVHMQKYATGETTRNKVDVIEPYKEMRVNCSNLDKAVNEDGILIDLFDYFIVAFILGYIEKIEITENLKQKVLEYFMDKLALDVEATASEIYLNYKADPGMKQVFFDSANNWDGANFWKIQLISAIRANKENDAIEFMDDAIRFLQLIEADIISAFSFPEISGNANKYMENVIRQMQTLGLKGEPSFKGEKE